jgi:ubiquinone/menaquinone biosynthesis C-methylase UbiE
MQVTQTIKNNRRQSERKNCCLPLVDDGNRILCRAINISSGGFLLETELNLDHQQPIRGKFQLPLSSEFAEVCGEVVWIKSSEGRQLNHIGLKFLDLPMKTQRLLQDYTTTSRINDLLKRFQKDLLSAEKNIKPIGAVGEIQKLFYEAKCNQAIMKIFWCKQYLHLSTVINSLDSNQLSLDIVESAKPDTINDFDHLFIQFTLGNVNYFFESIVKSTASNRLVTTIPNIIFFGERRVENRQCWSQQGPNLIVCTLPNGGEISAEVIDFNIAGLSFKLSKSYSYKPKVGELLKGLKISHAKASYPKAEVVHVTSSTHDERVYTVGIKFEVERHKYDFYPIKFENTVNPRPQNHPSTEVYDLALDKIRIVKYYNDCNEEITAILNSTIPLTSQRIEVPVVIIPPALGRRKETLGFLALSIIETFRTYNRDVIVIRYDGVRTVGESYNDRECRASGKEMLNFTMSQSVRDLLTTLDFLENYPGISCTNFIVLAFSMVSIIARKAILLDKKKRIDLCINVMGSTDVQDFLFNATGGLDYINEYQEGLKEGTFQVLGCLMTRKMLGDILDHEMAYLEHARRDMSQIDTPITWIYGKYDYWTNQKRVEDIMSIKSPSKRVVYEVPTGHIVKTSDEAMNVFGLIVKIMWQHLFEETVAPILPDLSIANKVNTAEWARVKRDAIDYKTYWKYYLLDKEEGKIGYDVLTFADDYNEFFGKQVDLLRLRKGELIADIGGGTGSFIKYYFDQVVRSGESNEVERSSKVIVLDLVWEALCKAKMKYRKFNQDLASPSVGMTFITADSDDEQTIPFKDNSFSRILASLLISYLRSPQKSIREFYRVLKPAGIIVISSLKPDADMSKPVTHLIEKIKKSDDLIEGTSKKEFLASAQSFMNLAASLFDLEEEKVFKFYTAGELVALLEQANFKEINIYESFGDPPQAIIAVAQKVR